MDNDSQTHSPQGQSQNIRTVKARASLPSAVLESRTSQTSQFIATPLASKPVRTLKVNTGSERASIFKAANVDIPLNDLGVVAFYYRADMLPETFWNIPRDTQIDLLEAAIEELDFAQGFPTTSNGNPFWGQLPHESEEAYRAFKAYLDLATRVEADGSNNAVRQLHILSTQLSTSTTVLVELSYIYYWQQRARAYDMFRIASHQQLKEQRLTHAENEHFQLATKYLALVDQKLQDAFMDPDNLDLKPKDMMDFMLKMIQVQRLSARISRLQGTQIMFSYS